VTAQISVSPAVEFVGADSPMRQVGTKAHTRVSNDISV